jgi:hypothetical protein
MRRYLTWIFALAALAAFSAFAAPRAYGLDNYLTLKFGIYEPVSGDLKDIDAATDFNGEGALGRYLLPNLSVELQSGYARSRDILRIIPLVAAIRVSALLGKFEPFVTGGAGFYFVRFEEGEDDVPFGYNGGLGFHYHTSPNGYLGVEAKHFWAEPSLAGQDIEINGVQLTVNFGAKF